MVGDLGIRVGAEDKAPVIGLFVCRWQGQPWVALLTHCPVARVHPPWPLVHPPWPLVTPHTILLTLQTPPPPLMCSLSSSSLRLLTHTAR